MYTTVELLDYRTFIVGATPPGHLRAGALHFLQYAADLLLDSRKDLAEASMNGQLQRVVPPTRTTMVTDAIDDTTAVMDAMTSLPSRPSQKVIDFGTWIVPLIPPGPRRTQLQRFLREVGILEDLLRRRFIAGAVAARMTAAVVNRSTMVTNVIADANALLAALNEMESGGDSGVA
jgi:hypothetical protein